MTATRLEETQSMRRSLGSAVVFGLGNGLAPGIGFLLLPVYTRELAPSAYGPLAVLLAISAAAGMLFSFGLDLGLFRSFFEYADDPARQRRFLASTWQLLVVAPAICVVPLALIALPFISSIRHVSELDIALALSSGALYAAGRVVPMVVMRVNQRLAGYMTLSVAYAIATTVFVFVAVVVLHTGITGWLTATTLANATGLVAAIVVVPWYRKERFDWQLLRRPIRFGFALLPHAFALWAIMLADRIVLATLVSAHDLGLYSLAANVGVPLGYATQALNQALMPNYAKAGLESSRREHLSEVILHQVLITVGLTLAGTLLGGPLVDLFAAPSYHSAAPLVVWIMLANGLTGLYLIPMNGVTIGAGRSSMVWIVSGCAAITNIALLFILVPSGGLEAAAISFAIASLVLVVGISIYSRGHGNPNIYRWRVLVPIAIAAAVIYALAALTTPDGAVSAAIERVGWLAVFAVLAALVWRADVRASGAVHVSKVSSS